MAIYTPGLYPDPAALDHCQACEAELYGDEAQPDDYGVLCGPCRHKAKLRAFACENMEDFIHFAVDGDPSILEEFREHYSYKYEEDQP